MGDSVEPEHATFFRHTTARLMTLPDLLSRLQNVRELPNGRYEARCPAHEDRKNSLSIAHGDNGGIVMHCHAGCTVQAILETLGLKLGDLMPDPVAPPPKPAKRKMSATYDYLDEKKTLLYQVVRYEPKDFRQRQPAGGDWIWNLEGVRRVLYRLPELAEAPLTRVVVVVEGEKDVDRLRKEGFLATTALGGAGTQWAGEWLDLMKGRNVVILPDNDESGDLYARRLADALLPLAQTVRVLRLPGLKHKGDVSDWLDAGGKVHDLKSLMTAEPVYQPAPRAETLAPVVEMKPKDGIQIKPMTIEEILAAARTPLEWTLQPLLTAKGVRLLSGMGKTYKSTLAIAMALTAVKGGRFTDSFRSGGGHSVAILDAENRPSVWARRLLAVSRGLEIDVEQLFRSGRVYYLNMRALYLDHPPTLAAIVDWLRSTMCTEIVIDSLTSIHRLNENDPGIMRRFFSDVIFRLRDECQLGVTILHHHRKGSAGFTDSPSEALRGSSDLRNVVDTHIALSRDRKDKAVIRVDVTAQREADEAGPFFLRSTWNENTLNFTTTEEPAHGRGPTVARGAKGVILEALETNPELTYVGAISAARDAGISERTAARVWRQIQNES